MPDFARSAHPAVQAQLDRLSLLSPGGDRLGLDRIGRLLDRLGRPQDALPPVFHVAGTNGKGSTCAFLRSALEAAGRRVHLFTSPHLVRYNERFRIAGRLIDDEPLASLLETAIEAGSGIEPSFFEVTTAVALMAFAAEPADACILEVGLGGRLDATNIIERPLVSAIASLGLDHQQFLGDTLLDVAGEKAGIAKAGAPLVTQAYPAALAARIASIAASANAPWLPRGEAWDATLDSNRLHYRDASGELDTALPQLAGDHQADNAALAIAVLRHQSTLEFDLAGLAATRWPARLQRLAPGPLTAGDREIWIDGGHNPSAAQRIADHLRSTWTDQRPLHLLFASLASKDPEGMLEPFRILAAAVHTLPIAGHEHRAPEELAALAQSMGLLGTAHQDLASALAATPPQARVLIFGSLYLAGQALQANGEQPT